MKKKLSPNAKLAQEIKQRVRHIRQLIAGVEKLCRKYGHCIHREQGSSNTHVTRELEVGQFLLIADIGQTMLGGNDFIIYWLGERVFSARSQGPGFYPDDIGSTVEVFKEGVWQKSFAEMVKKPETFLRKKTVAQKAKLKTSKRQEAQSQQLAQLRVIASRLGL